MQSVQCAVCRVHSWMYAKSTILMIMLVYYIQGVERQISARWFTTGTSMLPENPKSSYETSPRDSERVQGLSLALSLRIWFTYMLDNLHLFYLIMDLIPTLEYLWLYCFMWLVSFTATLILFFHQQKNNIHF